MTAIANVKDRSLGIGGSDVAGILGRSPWTTPLQVYLEKIGAADPIDETERMRWGNLLEEPVAQEYAHRTGHKVRRVNQTLHHEVHPCLMAHIDRRVVRGTDKLRRILEVKTSDKWARSEWGEDGSDMIPESYLLQVMHYLGVTGADICDIAALIGGNELRIFHVCRDEPLIAFLVAECSKFWREHVELENPPDASSLSEVALRYTEQVGAQLVADDDMLALVADLAQSQAMAKGLDDHIQQAKFSIAMQMRPADNPESIVSELVDHKGQALVTMKGHRRPQFRAKLLKEAKPKLYDEFCDEIEVRPFCVTKHGRALVQEEGSEAAK